MPRACSTAYPRLKPTPGVPDLANSGELPRAPPRSVRPAAAPAPVGPSPSDLK
jgi:hypothetical protein